MRRPDPTPIRVNRAPVLTLWAAVVAGRLGHPEETALTLGAAVAGTAARAEALRLGLAEASDEEAGERRNSDADGERRAVRLLGRELPVSRSDGGLLLAAHGERQQSPASTRTYLARAFGDRLGEVRAAMEGLARSLPPDELNRVGFYTLAAVRRRLWREQGLLMSRRAGEAAKPRPALQEALAHALCRTA